MTHKTAEELAIQVERVLAMSPYADLIMAARDYQETSKNGSSNDIIWKEYALRTAARTLPDPQSTHETNVKRVITSVINELRTSKTSCRQLRSWCANRLAETMGLPQQISED